MIRSIFVFSFVLLISNPVLSQKSLGFEFGYKRSNFNTDVTTTPYRSASRLQIGISYQQRIGLFKETKTNLKTGLYYEGKGSVATSTRIDINGSFINEVDVHNTLYYWSLPVIMEIYPFGDVFFLEGGLFVSYLAEQYFSEAALVKFESYDWGIGTFVPAQPSSFKSWDYGVSLGLGVSFNISERAEMKLTSRYSLGLADTNDDPRFNGKSFKNNGLLFSVGFNWLLGKK